MKLTKAQCDRFEPFEKSYKRFDGGGLYLEVLPTGKKLWRLKYYYLGKEKRLSFGRYPVITLNKAREQRRNAKQLLESGIDPSNQRKQEKRAAKIAEGNAFESVAREWHRKQLGKWGEKRPRTVMERLEKNVFPYLGHRPIATINSLEVLEVLQVIEDRGALEVAKRVKQICGQIFRYGVLTEHCNSDPTHMLSGALAKRKKKHFPAISPAELPEFLTALEEFKNRLTSQTYRAIWFSMLTFCRPGEIRHARWEDICFDTSTWIIPAAFMKSDKDHIVPLATKAIDILKAQRALVEDLGTLWVFPGTYKPQNPMSEGTVNVAIKRMGYKGRMTAHGFRALARTAIREELNYFPDVIETQLAHKPMGSLGAAYDRAQFLDKRREMIRDWAKYLSEMSEN